MKVTIITLTTATLLTLAGALQAQTVVTPTDVQDINGGVDFYDGWHSATVAEGQARGAAAVIEAQGRYNLDTSRANINNQQAYSQSIVNDKAATEAYFVERQYNRDARVAERNRRTSTMAEDASRYSKAMAPKRASGADIEPVFGTIYWPAVLKGSEFASSRMKLEEMFKNRDSASRGVNSSDYGAVVATTQAMQESLKNNIDSMSPQQYVQAKNFLKTLAYEAQFTPDMQGVAVR